MSKTARKSILAHRKQQIITLQNIILSREGKEDNVLSILGELLLEEK
jgi:hypothetical protein